MIGTMPRLLPCADGAILVHFGGEPDASERAAAFDEALRLALPAGVAETVPGLDSVLVVLDGTVRHREVSARVQEAADRLAIVSIPPLDRGRVVELPVRFGGDDGADLDALAEHAGIDAAGVVKMLTARPLRVAIVGHLPGLPYLVGLPPALDVPRLASPRAAVAEGSVGVAAAMACVYPARAPGGWHIVGRTSARLCDPEREPPFLLAPGDRVRFVDAGT
jgi:5-oxoprolinase (ATP-hydrolysing) subunit B